MSLNWPKSAKSAHKIGMARFVLFCFGQSEIKYQSSKCNLLNVTFLRQNYGLNIKILLLHCVAKNLTPKNRIKKFWKKNQSAKLPWLLIVDL